MSMSRNFFAAALAAALGFTGNVHAADVTGAGASFISPVMSKWSADFAQATGHKINYTSIGAGRRTSQFKASPLAFGSSEAPPQPPEIRRTSWRDNGLR